MSGDVPIYRHRPRFDTIEAFQYEGEFPMAFLRAGETVRRAAPGSSAVIIEQGAREVVVHRHQYVVRDLESGRISKDSADGWFRRYERTDLVAQGPIEVAS